ncbi:hypothetical protein ASC66_04455 [Leifsonia sp. Root4]|uniref:hypothetical protein n=1 Tax=Leifsonia sp. Root4 TaxID=1736525 RepID=UPI0006FF7DF7|nr:hypothetical protein [Leifsonia sp. Root4]KQW08189.1 hypothetical protein ASC66_04455 [Leifsonia sp. Root4]
MPRTARRKPNEIVRSWPTVKSEDPVGEVARRFTLNLREAIGERSIRAAARAADLSHVTLVAILEGRTWPDMETIAKLELFLDADLWPGRQKPSSDEQPAD